PSDTVASDIYALSLHDALPISFLGDLAVDHRKTGVVQQIDQILAREAIVLDEVDEKILQLGGADVGTEQLRLVGLIAHVHLQRRSEEHTSELQSRENLVCRLLL